MPISNAELSEASKQALNVITRCIAVVREHKFIDESSPVFKELKNIQGDLFMILAKDQD